MSMSSSSLPSLCISGTRWLERRRRRVGERAGDAFSALTGEKKSGSSSSSSHCPRLPSLQSCVGAAVCSSTFCPCRAVCALLWGARSAFRALLEGAGAHNGTRGVVATEANFGARAGKAEQGGRGPVRTKGESTRAKTGEENAPLLR